MRRLLFIAGLSLPLLAGGPSFCQESSRAVLPSEGYLLRVGDEIQITVLGREDLSRTVQIREDGTISLVFIGSVQAAGRSAADLEKEIRERLKSFLPAPNTPETPESTTVIHPEDVPKNPFYRLQIGDDLEISVWNQLDLNTKTQIREDGTFSFPLIGNVQGVGRSLQEVEKDVRELLDKDFIVNPQVAIQLSGAKFTVLGEVVNPGPYAYVGTVDLLSALSQAGGLTKSGSERIDVIRSQGDKKLSIRMNLDAVLRGSELNLPILPRDAIMVYPQIDPKQNAEVVVRLSGAKYTVLGEVERPGSFSMESAIDALTAISQAGGLTKFGSSHIEIIRTRGDQKIRIRLNLDRIIQGTDPNPQILPHDTVYVKRRLF